MRARTGAVAVVVAGLTAGLGASRAVADPDHVTVATPPTATASLPTAGSWAIGYSAVIRATGPSATTGRLELIGPNGGVVKTISPSVSASFAYVDDVRYDAGRVVTSQSVVAQGKDYTRLTVYDVAAGTSRSFALPGYARAYFTHGGLLTTDYQGSPDGPAAAVRTTLRDLTGRWQRTYPTLPGTDGTEVSPGGTLVMQSTDRGVVLRRAANGTVVRTIPRPSGTESCNPLGLWGQGYVKMLCDNYDTQGDYRVLAVRTADGRQVPVTSRGYLNAWPTTTRRSVLQSQSESTRVGHVSGSTFAPYVVAPNPEQYGLGAHGSSIWIGDSSAGWVKRKDVVSGTVRHLVGASSSLPGYVSSARLVDTVN